MKIYTQVIDIALQSPKRFWVAPYSDFKIGVKIVKKGTPVANEFTVKQGDTTLTADETPVDGFKTYTLKSGATGSVEYVVEVAGVGEKQKITQIVTDSTVFEVGGEGGSGGVTQQWVEDYVAAETSAFITEVPANLSVETLDVKNDAYTVITAGTDSNQNDSGVLNVKGTYGKLRVGGNNDINAVRINANGTTPNIQVGKMGTSDNPAVALSCDAQGHGLLVLDNMPFGASTLSTYVTASEMNTAISTATSDKVTGTAVGQAPVVSAIAAVYVTPWATLSANADANTVYVVLPDPVLPTRVKYTAASGLPDWESSVVGTLNGNQDIPNWFSAEYVEVGSLVTDLEFFNGTFGTLKGVTIPEGVTTIGVTCFENGRGLSSLVIPSSVTSIGEGAFSELSLQITMVGKTMAQVQAMTNYSWYLASGSIIHCTDGDITIS